MTKTTPLSSNNEEFTIHVPKKYDYRFKTERRQEIMDIIKRAYLAMIGENIEIYYAQTKDLQTFTTTERDSLKGICRFPPKNMQRHDEDLVKNNGLMPILLSKTKCLNNRTASQEMEAKENDFGGSR